MSIEALWTMYSGNVYEPGLVEGMAAAGVVVFETGRLFGGDSGYYYLGTYEVAGGRLSGTATVQHYNGPPTSAFGPDIKFNEVEFEGDIEGGEISGQMWVKGIPELRLPIKMYRQAELP